MEKLMQYVWAHRLWPRQRMSTTDGRRISVIDPGRLNTDAGPDFFNAKVAIDGETWIGNIEIHVKASDWARHGHDNDPAYDNVILHVVDVSDTLIERRNGSGTIPQLVMQCAPDLNRHYAGLVNSASSDIACRPAIAAMERVHLLDWSDSLAHERLHEKADRIAAYVEALDGDWEHAAFTAIARALGSGINGDIFERLAKSLPPRLVARHNDSLLMTEAMVFGQSGLLDNAPVNDYTSALRREFQFLAAKFRLQRPQGMLWKMARMRPASFPHRRLALLSAMLHRSTRFLGRLLEIVRDQEFPKLFRQHFELAPEGFWRDHYTFVDSPSEAARSSASTVGSATLLTLMINAVIPVAYAYGNHTGDFALSDLAVERLQSLPPERNSIVRMFADAGMPCDNAADTQALVQLRRAYCEQRKCLYCRIGHRVLSKAAVRV